MSALSNGFAQLFKSWGKGIGKAADNFLLDAEARKAISDEVRSKFKSKIDLARAAENKRAENIKDLDKKLAESKDKWQKDQDKWNEDYNNALADARTQRQSDIADYKAQLQGYKDTLAKAKAGRDNILDQLRDSEAHYNPYNTIFTDVKTGKPYIFDLSTGGYRGLDSLSKKEIKDFRKNSRNFDNRLIDFSTNPSGIVLNAFDESTKKLYKGKNAFFDNYYPNRISIQDAAALRDAENQIKQARGDLTAWQSKGQPTTLNERSFKSNYEKTNGGLPTEYSFNGQTYKDATALDSAYQDALKHEKALQNSASKAGSKEISNQKAEIARRIQDAKDVKKAKLALGALGAGAGAGALYAGARAMYGGDDTDNIDNTDNINNIDNTDNTYTGEPDPDFKAENTPEGKAALNGKSLTDTGFDPDKADALASAAYVKGVEDGNSVESSGDLGNNIAASTGGHTIDDGLFELLKAMQDPHKADAVANYIYSRHGDDPELQRLGWRAWLNKYYGDSLRSSMNIDPSGYNGMHVSGGL